MKLYRVTDVGPGDSYRRIPERVVGAIVCEERSNPHEYNPFTVVNGRARGWCDIFKAAPGVDNFHTFSTSGFEAGETLCLFDVGVEELP